MRIRQTEAVGMHDGDLADLTGCLQVAKVAEAPAHQAEGVEPLLLHVATLVLQPPLSDQLENRHSPAVEPPPHQRSGVKQQPLSHTGVDLGHGAYPPRHQPPAMGTHKEPGVDWSSNRNVIEP